MSKEQYDPDFVYLTDGNGREVAFAFLDMVDYKDSRYAVLLPADDVRPEALILEVTDVDPKTGEETYVFPDDDEVLDAVFEIFMEAHQGEFDF